MSPKVTVWPPKEIEEQKVPENSVTPCNLKEPPCPSCAHWMPRVIKTTSDRTYKFCWSNDRQSDFSCFEEAK